MANPSKRLILVRHAHRETSNRALDNGLSQKGKAQAEQISEFYLKRFPTSVPRIYSSPKLRCFETVKPLATKLGTDVEPVRQLLEQQHDEQLHLFQNRIQEFYEEWKRDPDELVLLCSHGDWIPLFLRMVTGAVVRCKKSSWIEIVKEPGQKAVIQWVIQNFSRE